MDRFFVIAGSLFMMVGVGAGAFGAHGLSPYFERYPALAATFETAVRYHMIHALALFVVAWASTRYVPALATWAGYLFILGILLFSGSLYLLVFTRVSWLGAVTPLGGVAFVAGWLLLALSAWRS
jgi:uncharacterized membrane protein YgdD (TMEM256/DUF423 family)